MQKLNNSFVEQAERLAKENNIDEAIAVCEQGIVFFEAQKKWDQWVRTMTCKSYHLQMAGRVKEALLVEQENLHVAEKYFPKISEEIAVIYGSIGKIYFNLLEFNLSLQYAQSALELLLQLPDHSPHQIGTVYSNIGTILFHKGDDERALQHFKKALNLLSQAPKESALNLPSTHINIGIYYSVNGDFDHALKYFYRGLSILLQTVGEWHLHTALAYSNIGATHRMKNDYDNALENFEKSLSIELKILGEHNSVTASTYENIANVLQGKNEMVKALAHFEKALNIYQQTIGEQNHLVAYIYQNIGSYYDKEGDFAQSLLYLQKSLAIRLSIFGNVHPETALAYKMIGDNYGKTDHVNEALQYYQQTLLSIDVPISNTDFYSLPLLGNSNNAPLLLQTLIAKGIVFYQIYQQTASPQNLMAALAHYYCADELINQIRKSYKTESSKLLLANSATTSLYIPAINMAWVAYQQETENNLSINQLAKQMGYQLPSKAIDLAFMFSEKSKAMLLFTDLKSEDAKISAQIPADILEEIQQLRVELNYLDNQIAEENSEKIDIRNHARIQQWQQQHFEYKQQYDQLIENIETNYPNYHQITFNIQTVSIEQIQQTLPSGAALIEYFISDEHIYIYCITPANSHLIAIELANVHIIEAVDRLLKTIAISRPSVGGRNAFAKASYHLYQLIFEPLTRYLPASCQQLIIIPASDLYRLPFEALITHPVPSGESYNNMPYLGTKYATQYHYSATLWHYGLGKKNTPTQSNAAQGSYVGFAPVVYNTISTADTPNREETAIEKQRLGLLGSDYATLPYTEQEITSVSSLLKQQGYNDVVYLHKEATVEQFKNTIQQQSNLHFLHIATHGVYNTQHPQLSGIIFSSNIADVPKQKTTDDVDKKEETLSQPYRNILYIGDTYQLNLKNVQLVVLSCCDTGLGIMAQGEGMMAINRGFLYAGSQNVVYTLFKIVDQQSNLLVHALFKHILLGNSYVVALKNAKQEVLQQPNIRPIHWAGFVLMGN